ncbi:MAG: alpha/beta fold hydrolase [Bacteroidia bacterium]|nr:alpha/beta fold hydrolase [Bacteroidia bacterium]
MKGIRPPHFFAWIILTTVLFVGWSNLFAQQPVHLRRKCFMGMQPAPIPDSLAIASGQKQGVLVAAVVPGGTMEAIGALPNDVLMQFDGKAVPDWDGLRQLLMQKFEGDPVSIKVWRSAGKKSKELELKGQIKGAAREQSNAKYDILYDEAAFEDGWLRTITMTPKSAGPHPIIYFIPGYNCFSIDNMNPNGPYRKLFDSLATLGNIIYRVEKPGMGDGPSPCNCEVTGFEKELSAFEAGYKKLLSYPWAAENRIFLVGHSMGGVQAPLLATKGNYHPKGIAVYGTVFQTWYEYILMMLRFQEPRSEEDYIAFEGDMQAYIRLFYEHYVLYKPLDEIIQNPQWKALLERDFALDAAGNILFRRAEYWQEISRHTLTDAWAKTDAHVLSMFGEADFEVFDAFSMEEIARIVNHYHPGKGKFVMIPGTDHGMIEVGSMAKGLELRNKPEYRDYYNKRFNYKIVTEIDQWIQLVLKTG